MKKLILVLLAVLPFLSCGKQDESLGVSILANRTNLINAKATSCSAIINRPPTGATSGDVSARYFQLMSPTTLTWNKVGSMATVYNIHFNLQGGPMGDIKADIAGDELKALFGIPTTSNATPTLNQATYAADGTTVIPQSKDLACAVVVGGISISDKDDVAMDFNATGTIEGFETELDANGNPTGAQTEFSRDFYFTVHNRGK